MAFTWSEAIAELEQRRARALELGGPARIKRQHERGKQTARERLDMILDPGSFKEIGMLATYNRPRADGAGFETTPSGLVAGLAKIDGRDVAISAHDYTVSGGTTTTYLTRVKGEVGGFTDDMAYDYKIPLISLVDGAGAGDEPNVTGSGSVFIPNGYYNRALTLMDEVPVLGALLGPAAGLAAGRSVLGHFTVMTRETACLFMGGPPVVKVALGLDVGKFELGGAGVHTTVGGIDNVAEDEADAMRQIRTVLSFLPQNVWQAPPVLPETDPITRRGDDLLKIMPENRRRAFDPRKIINEIFDRDTFFEIGRDWGKSIVQGFARIGGYPVGVLCGNPSHLGGALDAKSCDKQVRFMAFCDTFHLPIVTLIDNGGFMLGPDAERSGINRAALRAMMAVQYIDVPIVAIYMRKAYGLGVISQYNDKMGLRLAWPTAESGAMPAEGEVDALFAREIAEAEDPVAYRQMAIDRLHALKSPWKKAESFELSDVIHPAETREYIGRFIAASWHRISGRLGPPRRWPIV